MFKTCLLCKSSNLSPVLTLTHQPVVQNVYYPSKEQATSMKTTDLTIVECQNCHFIFNSSFDESLAHSEYDADYTYVPPRNALFKEHLELLTKKFIDDYNVTNTEVADIGCGYPEFLELLAREGNNACLGIDPSAPREVPDKRVTLKRALFEGDFFGFNPKLVILRQVVEHVSDPIAFLSTIKDALSEGAYIYIEIPNIAQSFERKYLHDFYHEHVGYYTKDTLRYLLELTGLEIVELKLSYGEQSLSALTRVTSKIKQTIPTPPHDEVKGVSQIAQTLNTLREGASRVAKESKEWAIWGAGAKGITFTNLIDSTSSRNLIAIDANPDKGNRYIGGSGVLIYSEKDLSTKKLDTVVIMNALYKDEITIALKKHNNGDAKIMLYEDLIA